MVLSKRRTRICTESFRKWRHRTANDMGNSLLCYLLTEQRWAHLLGQLPSSSSVVLKQSYTSKFRYCHYGYSLNWTCLKKTRDDIVLFTTTSSMKNDLLQPITSNATVNALLFNKKIKSITYKQGNLVLKCILPNARDSRDKINPYYEGSFVIKQAFSGGVTFDNRSKLIPYDVTTLERGIPLTMTFSLRLSTSKMSLHCA